ncbi:MAG: hypothetical protein HC849_23525 [Oscillatoriales cyanobacterium RU_3_3]|nr:hypothetical protein [Microcoleus sp. SM1_3_4]NJM62494.1 hypothetical protein [Oscillatoriales cyanobacterium RU_3_3]
MVTGNWQHSGNFAIESIPSAKASVSRRQSQISNLKLFTGFEILDFEGGD